MYWKNIVDNYPKAIYNLVLFLRDKYGMQSGELMISDTEKIMLIDAALDHDSNDTIVSIDDLRSFFKDNQIDPAPVSIPSEIEDLPFKKWPENDIYYGFQLCFQKIEDSLKR